MTTELRPPDPVVNPRLKVEVIAGRPAVLLTDRARADFSGWCISYERAKRLYHYINAQRGAGLFHPSQAARGYCVRDDTGGGYTRIRLFRVCKTGVRVGCQIIRYKDIAAFAKLQGWPALRAAPKKEKAS